MEVLAEHCLARVWFKNGKKVPQYKIVDIKGYIITYMSRVEAFATGINIWGNTKLDSTCEQLKEYLNAKVLYVT